MTWVILDEKVGAKNKKILLTLKAIVLVEVTFSAYIFRELVRKVVMLILSSSSNMGHLG
jgi:hypothetical protein